MFNPERQQEVNKSDLTKLEDELRDVIFDIGDMESFALPGEKETTDFKFKKESLELKKKDLIEKVKALIGSGRFVKNDGRERIYNLINSEENSGNIDEEIERTYGIAS